MMTNSLRPPTFGFVEADWLANNLHQENLLILDSTTNIVANENHEEKIVPEWDVFQANHIPTAQFLDLQGVLSDQSSPFNFMLPNTDQFEQVLRQFGINQNSIVVIYSSGNPWWATRIWWMFRHFGLDNAYVLNGGLRYWQQLGLPVEQGSPSKRAKGNITITSPRQLAIDGDTLKQRLGEPGLTLINALPNDKFTGINSVHGGRPGHIPGSINVPAASLIDKDTGLFLKPEAIAKILNYHQLLEKNNEIIAYCGGGISASLIVFALALFNQNNVKLYDASLSEWAHREDFPLHVTDTL
ncbi:sulfurtransferase [Advenella sp. RU8]|uniref:sulfurtransferase n=1 Tax=Advenella sp. RU8 TaxID=3399575 RepID=UPI003AAA8C20